MKNRAGIPVQQMISEDDLSKYPLESAQERKNVVEMSNQHNLFSFSYKTKII